MRVVVFEDDLIVTRVFRTMLERRGCEVFATAIGKQVVDLLRDNHVDLLICDLLAPNCCGTEVALQAIRFQPTLKVLFSSALPIHLWTPFQLTPVEQIEKESYAFMPKPFTIATLNAAVDKLMAQEALPTEKKVCA
jgi:DNA-binding NtrC family response regulator